ncbi:MAG: Peptide chain release factor 1, partial [uncultured Pseudonocardia sp.]
ERSRPVVGAARRARVPGARARRPGGARRPVACPPSGPPLRAARSARRDGPRPRRGARQPGHGPGARRGGRVLRHRGHRPGGPGRGAHRPSARAPAAARPGRRQGRHPRDQGGGGRRRVRAVRRRPAAHVPPLRRAPRLVGRGTGGRRRRAGRLQGRRGRHQVPIARGRRRSGDLGPAEVRGRRPPGAARAGHREPGAHPHLGSRCARAARGRGGRRQRRPGRSADRRLPLVGSRRAEREHHRLRGPDHPPAERHRGQLAEREEPAAEPGVRAARAPVPAAGRRARGGRR